MNHELYMREAIRLAKEGMDGDHGGPFGAVIVKDKQIIGSGYNRVIELSDPTAHAEVVAIRDAAATLQSPWLEDCDLYTSCQPCPMCLSSSLWAHIRKIFYAGTEADAASIGFDDAEFYRKMGFEFGNVSVDTVAMMRDEAAAVMKEWLEKMDRQQY